MEKTKKMTIDEILGKEKKMHWKVIAYKKKADNGGLLEATELVVNHYTNEADAIKAAKQIVVRPFYFLKEVWECTQCKTQEEQEKMFRIVKKHLEG